MPHTKTHDGSVREDAGSREAEATRLIHLWVESRDGIDRREEFAAERNLSICLNDRFPGEAVMDYTGLVIVLWPDMELRSYRPVEV